MGEGVFICETVRVHAHLNVRVGARAKMRVACPRKRRKQRSTKPRGPGGVWLRRELPQKSKAGAREAKMQS
jgi:hypothetical protein